MKLDWIRTTKKMWVPQKNGGRTAKKSGFQVVSYKQETIQPI